MNNTAPTRPSPMFTNLAWAMMVYLLGVILFGAWVRITGSGAGCGSHWPTCHGELIPPNPTTATIIEYTHRLTSGMCGVFGIGLWVWAGRLFGWRSKITLASLGCLFFIIVEGAIGAGLVLKELVADDASEARATVISLHLVNTLALLAMSSLAAWWSKPRTANPAARLVKPLGVVLGLLILVSMSGAVTALGDTLFPVTVGPEGMLDHVLADLSPTQHFLVRLRIVHPILAMLVALGAWRVALSCLDDAQGETLVLGRVALWGVSVQVIVGLANIWLGAPGWMQLLHLLIAEVIWVSFLLLFLSARGRAMSEA